MRIYINAEASAMGESDSTSACVPFLILEDLDDTYMLYLVRMRCQQGTLCLAERLVLVGCN